MSSKLTPVVAYIRVSRVGNREREGRFISPELQREQVEALARREGLDVIDWLQELDASGGDASRPLWNRAIEMVERGEAAGLAVWNLSRFSRSVKDALNALERIEAAGGRVYSATEDFGTGATAKMLRTILLAVAENERERAKAGFKAATLNALDRGVFIGGTVPFGYRRDPGSKRLTVHPEEAAIVRGLFERRSKGMSWARLAAWASEQGYEMTDPGVNYLVHNPTYLGQIRSGDEVREGTHEAIVSKSLWKRCQEKQQRSARSGILTRRYLLQGLVLCSGCGRALYLSSGRKRNGKVNTFYYCRNPKCSHRAYARAEELDFHVVDQAFEPMREGGLEAQRMLIQAGKNGEDLTEAENELADAEQNLNEWLANRDLIRVLGAERYNAETEEYVMAVQIAREEVDRAREAHSDKFELFGDLWAKEWSHEDKRDWLGRTIRQVIVRKGREPLDDRVEVELR